MLYVFPSLDRCELVVDKRAIFLIPELAANLISGCKISGPKSIPLESPQVWSAVHNGEISPMLDGYISLNIPDGFPSDLPANVLAVKRSLNRSKNILTVFFEAEGNFWVSKLTVADYSGLTASNQGVDFHFPVKERVYPGIGYELFIQDLALRKDWGGVFRSLENFLDVSFSRFSLTTENINGLAIDAIPRNAVIDVNGEIYFFDLEFSDCGEISKSFYIYRVCISIMGRKGYLFDGCGYRCIYDVYKRFCMRYGLPFNIRREMALERIFQSRVAGTISDKKIKISRALKDFSQKKSLLLTVRKLPTIMEIWVNWIYYYLRKPLVQKNTNSLEERG